MQDPSASGNFVASPRNYQPLVGAPEVGINDASGIVAHLADKKGAVPKKWEVAAFWVSRLGYWSQTAEALYLGVLSMKLAFTHQLCSSLPIFAPSLSDYEACGLYVKNDWVGVSLVVVAAFFATAFTIPVFYQCRPQQNCLLHPTSSLLVQATRIVIAVGAVSLQKNISYLFLLIAFMLAATGTHLTVNYERVVADVMSWVDENERALSATGTKQQPQHKFYLYHQVVPWFFIIINSLSVGLSFKNLSTSYIPRWGQWIGASLIAAGNIPYMKKLTVFARANYYRRFIDLSCVGGDTEDISMVGNIKVFDCEKYRPRLHKAFRFQHKNIIRKRSDNSSTAH